MKKVRLTFVALSIAVAGLFAFNKIDFDPGSIKGTVVPADGAVRAWAVSGTDTLRSAIKDDGAFLITEAKPGTYRVIIEAKPGYKNAAKENVTVVDGQPTDVGEIKLENNK
jgi:hypothetical protein